MLWRCETWLSSGQLLCGASNALPFVDINLVGANWKTEKRKNVPAYVFAVAGDTEQGTKPSRVSANPSLGLCVLSAGRRLGKHLCLRRSVYSRELCH